MPLPGAHNLDVMSYTVNWCREGTSQAVVELGRGLKRLRTFAQPPGLSARGHLHYMASSLIHLYSMDMVSASTFSHSTSSCLQRQPLDDGFFSRGLGGSNTVSSSRSQLFASVGLKWVNDLWFLYKNLTNNNEYGNMDILSP